MTLNVLNVVQNAHLKQRAMSVNLGTMAQSVQNIAQMVVQTENVNLSPENASVAV